MAVIAVLARLASLYRCRRAGKFRLVVEGVAILGIYCSHAENQARFSILSRSFKLMQHAPGSRDSRF